MPKRDSRSQILPLPTADIQEMYQLGVEIGSGCFGTVRTCERIESSSDATECASSQLACKSLLKSKIRSSRDVDAVRSEVLSLSTVSDSCYVTSLHDVLEDGNSVHLIMDYCPGGDLFDFLSTHGPCNEMQAANVFYQLCKAVEHCHSKNILHRDLKPENVFLTIPNQICGSLAQSGKFQPCLKLGDFGLSAMIERGQKISGNCGSTYYVAPEVLQGSYDFSADIWSLGIVLYLLLSGSIPFMGPSVEEIQKQILTKPAEFPKESWQGVSLEVQDLIASMLSKEPLRRPSIATILNNKWMKAFYARIASKLAVTAKKSHRRRLSAPAELDALNLL